MGARRQKRFSDFGFRACLGFRFSDLEFPRMTPGLEHYLVVSGILFSLGLLGVICRRNLLVIYMALELMLNAANLALVAFSRFNNLDGQVMVFFIITVAAAEVAVGLALIVALYRKRQTAHVEDLTTLKL
jgi:NADH-quinone oxidoreductase subunit K